MQGLRGRPYKDSTKTCNSELASDKELEEEFEQGTRSAIGRILRESKDKKKVIIVSHSSVFKSKSFQEIIKFQKKEIDFAEMVNFSFGK